MEKTDFRMRNEDGDLVLDGDGKDQRETNANKIEQIKCHFEAKKIECTEELRLHNYKLRQFEDNKEKAHSPIDGKLLLDTDETWN